MHSETELLLEEKTKLEGRPSETLITIILAKEKAIYCLKKWSVSNISGDIIFLTRSLERLKQTSHCKWEMIGQW